MNRQIDRQSELLSRVHATYKKIDSFSFGKRDIFVDKGEGGGVKKNASYSSCLSKKALRTV